jgi:hypothetical protein
VDEYLSEPQSLAAEALKPLHVLASFLHLMGSTDKQDCHHLDRKLYCSISNDRCNMFNVWHTVIIPLPRVKVGRYYMLDTSACIRDIRIYLASSAKTHCLQEKIYTKSSASDCLL